MRDFEKEANYLFLWLRKEGYLSSSVDLRDLVMICEKLKEALEDAYDEGFFEGYGDT